MEDVKTKCCSIPFNYYKPPYKNTSGFIHEPINMSVACNCKQCLKSYIIQKYMAKIEKINNHNVTNSMLRALGDTVAQIDCRCGCS